MKMQQRGWRNRVWDSRNRPSALVGILALVSLGLFFVAFSLRSGQEVPPLTWSRDDIHTLLPWTLEGSAEGVEEEGSGRDHIKSPLYVFWRKELMEFVWVMDHMLAKVGRPLKAVFSLGEIPPTDRLHLLVVVSFDMAPPEYYLKLMEMLRAELGSSARIGLLHLSDEHANLFWHEGYAMADFVWRNYWQDSLPHSVQQHWNGIPDSRAGGTVPVRWFPLGTVRDLVLPAGLAAERQRLVASQREKLCFFAGSIKRNRAQLKTELEHGIHYTYDVRERTIFCHWEETGSFAQGSRVVYRTRLLSSVFTLCPHGVGTDQFRIWEALEAGSIPILEDDQLWKQLPSGHPLWIVESWQGITHKLGRYASNCSLLDELQHKTLDWWRAYKTQLQTDFANSVEGKAA